jgi:hypothetical protein
MAARRHAALRPLDPAWRSAARAFWVALHTPAHRVLLAALLLLLVAAALAGVLAPGWQAEAAHFEAQAHRQLAALAASRQAPPTPDWPAATTLPPRVQTLLGLAERHGVTVRAWRDDGGERPPVGAVSPASIGSAPRWRGLVLSAEGDYAALRRFTSAALAADAALALDTLRFSRADLGSATLRAEFGFALAHAAVPAVPAAAPPRRGRP